MIYSYHPYVDANLYDFISSLEQKRRYFEAELL